MPRAKPGPKPRAGETADTELRVRLTATELESYRAAAERDGSSLSDWVRDACDVRLGEESPSGRGEIMRACGEIEDLLETIRDSV